MAVRSTEVVLIERCRKGDLAAFDELVGMYEKKAYNLAYRMTGNHEDASDVAQEAFLRVFNSLGDFRGDASFSTWLYRIVSNVCWDELRRRRRHFAASLDEPVATEEGGYVRQVMDHSPGPEESLERKELQAVVQEGINELSPDHRFAVILRDIKGLSYEEIADILDCSLGTVKSRLNRARNALKEKLLAKELFATRAVQTGERRDGR